MKLLLLCNLLCSISLRKSQPLGLMLFLYIEHMELMLKFHAFSRVVCLSQFFENTHTLFVNIGNSFLCLLCGIVVGCNPHFDVRLLILDAHLFGFA